MLGDHDSIPTLAVKDQQTARNVYEGVLGLSPTGEPPEEVMHRAGSTTVLVYPSTYAGTNKATAMSFQIPPDAFDAEVALIRETGVTFSTFEAEDLEWDDGVASMGGTSESAWFRDPDGNTLNVETGMSRAGSAQAEPLPQPDLQRQVDAGGPSGQSCAPHRQRGLHHGGPRAQGHQSPVSNRCRETSDVNGDQQGHGDPGQVRLRQEHVHVRVGLIGDPVLSEDHALHAAWCQPRAATGRPEQRVLLPPAGKHVAELEVRQPGNGIRKILQQALADGTRKPCG
ncbi:MAG: VOC family protein [Ornithinibacter sp.]